MSADRLDELAAALRLDEIEQGRGYAPAILLLLALWGTGARACRASNAELMALTTLTKREVVSALAQLEGSGLVARSYAHPGSRSGRAIHLTLCLGTPPRVAFPPAAVLEHLRAAASELRPRPAMLIATGVLAWVIAAATGGPVDGAGIRRILGAQHGGSFSRRRRELESIIASMPADFRASTGAPASEAAGGV